MEPDNLLSGLDLDNPMSGLDLSSNIHYQPATCLVAEIRRDSNGNSPQSSQALELALSQERFARLTQRYHFASVLEAWRHLALSGYSVRKANYNNSGELTSAAFTMSIRLSGSFASTFALNHNYTTCTTVVLALRVCPQEQMLLQQALQRHSDLIGHPLLVPACLVEVCLETNKQFTQKILHELGIIETTTGQHGWLQIPAMDASAHDSELSRLGHAVKQYISVSRRRVDSIQCHLNRIMQCMGDPRVHDSETQSEFEEWIANIQLMVKFRQADVAYSERRADNQITAIYGLLTQRDNMVGVSVAVESKKISEASKRDGAALKSLTVLTAVFFPATFIATLFALPRFSHAPFWLYWLIVIPLTLMVFGLWACWTLYRQRRLSHESTGPSLEKGLQSNIRTEFRPNSPLLANSLRQGMLN
ncbi:hypothetical protein BJX66DRAFT_351941 [Aspergillus keveii]|uniref:Uncharacterized protein n=1 Tax=Aspergillus keveii TaxID=714993 RepID=A0ABR4G2G8_9EURO